MLGPEAFAATFHFPFVALLVVMAAVAAWGLHGRRRLHRLLIGHVAIAALVVSGIARLHRMLELIFPGVDLASLALVAYVAVVGVVVDAASEAPVRAWMRLLGTAAEPLRPPPMTCRTPRLRRSRSRA